MVPFVYSFHFSDIRSNEKITKNILDVKTNMKLLAHAE